MKSLLEWLTPPKIGTAYQRQANGRHYVVEQYFNEGMFIVDAARNRIWVDVYTLKTLFKQI